MHNMHNLLVGFENVPFCAARRERAFLKSPLQQAGNSHQEARSRLFCDALTYALTEEEAREIMDSSDMDRPGQFRHCIPPVPQRSDVGRHLQAQVQSACERHCYARSHFENKVFNVLRKTKEIQDHLGLQMHESILDQ